MALLDRDKIVEALTRLNSHLAERGERAELFLVGGAVMCLVHKARPASKDDDAWFTSPQAVREAARVVAMEMALDENWLNDAAKAFVPEHPGYEAWQTFSHLTISVVDARTLLAMKCAAARTEIDAEDIRSLGREAEPALGRRGPAGGARLLPGRTIAGPRSAPSRGDVR
jgi:hypothetical protein